MEIDKIYPVKKLLIAKRVIAKYVIQGETVFLAVTAEGFSEDFCIMQIQRLENKTFKFLAFLNLETDN